MAVAEGRRGDWVARQIERAVRDGQFRERLPPERLLAARYGVSRATIRDAVALLAARGLVRRRQGAGTFINDVANRRMAELFAERAERIVALDKSLAMLRVARAKLQHLPAERVELVQGDFGSLPFAADSFDTVLFHQVLHFAQAPATVLAEAGRVTRPDGRVAIVDFAAHQREELRDRHAHARLGFEDSALAGMLDAAGFEPAAPIALEDGELVVKIWIAQRRAANRKAAS